MLWRSGLLGLLTLAAVSGAAPAQPDAGRDPLALYPENYRLLLENERVRVIDFRLARGAREDAHTHPPHVVHVLTGFKIRFTFPDGSTAIRETRAGDVLWSEAVTHASENIGDSDAHGILVEPKPAAGAAAPDPGLLTAVTFITGAEGRGEELARELLALAPPTRAEPGNLLYDLYRSPENPDAFMRLEVWRDAAALEEHKATPHIRASFQKRAEQGWKTQITTWERVPEPAPR